MKVDERGSLHLFFQNSTSTVKHLTFCFHSWQITFHVHKAACLVLLLQWFSVFFKFRERDYMRPSRNISYFFVLVYVMLCTFREETRKVSVNLTPFA